MLLIANSTLFVESIDLELEALASVTNAQRFVKTVKFT
jgi:N-glycosylase/DNA lyase